MHPDWTLPTTALSSPRPYFFLGRPPRCCVHIVTTPKNWLQSGCAMCRAASGHGQRRAAPGALAFWVPCAANQRRPGFRAAAHTAAAWQCCAYMYKQISILLKDHIGFSNEIQRWKDHAVGLLDAITDSDRDGKLGSVTFSQCATRSHDTCTKESTTHQNDEAVRQMADYM